MTELERHVAGIFDRAPFMRDLGVTLVDVGEGWVTTELELDDRLRQQHGFAHAGVVATLADHTAGAAATTMIAAGLSVLTADFTVHLLRPGAGDRLASRGEVIKAGRTLIITHADVWADERHIARYTGTMSVVELPL